MTAPAATYRLQLHKDFTLADAEAIADYLGELHISHLYLSPVFESAPGSPHGYDVTDFAKVSAERGGEEGLRRLAEKLSRQEPPLRLLLDIVPNHMAASLKNPYWRDVLARGRESRYWRFFDIFAEAGEKLTLPLLDCDCAEAIAAGKIVLAEKDDGFRLQVNGQEYPLNTESEALLKKQRGKADLAALIDMQHYALIPYWELSRLNYRRFFNVSDLVCLRTEEEEIFEESHAALRRLLAGIPAIAGLRIDHIDGLAAPAEYLSRLSRINNGLWVEKILARDEPLPTTWPVRGTTGYEFIDRLHGLLAYRPGYEIIRRYWHEEIENSWPDFAACVYQAKTETIRDYFEADLARLATLLELQAEQRKAAARFITALAAAMPVYRGYPGHPAAAEGIRNAAAAAAAYEEEWFAKAAEKYLPALLSPRDAQEKLFASRWNQFSGPAMAKGLEDRAHYRYTPLAAFNEVGCAPVLTPEGGAFSAHLQALRDCPESLNASTTHDTKRSEDARMRLIALCDLPQQWLGFCKRAFAIAAPHAANISKSVQYLFFQSVVATWPLAGDIDGEYRRRLAGYMMKAAREESRHTTWMKPNPKYEAALADFVATMLQDSGFAKLTQAFLQPIGRAGAINSLAALTLKILSQGLPDFYQGTEIWDFSLVDPDNRRPVDYARRRLLLAGIKHAEKSNADALLQELTTRWHDGAVKIWLTRQLLKLRAEYFADVKSIKAVTPLEVAGPRKNHLLAYMIELGEKRILVAIPRYPGLLPGGESLSFPAEAWEDTNILLPEVAQKELVCGLSGKTFPACAAFPAAKALRRFPVAVLIA